MSSFGRVLRRLRKNNNLTQVQLASALGLAYSTISMYEREKREPDFETLEIIADYFNVSMDYLHGKIFDPSPNSNITFSRLTAPTPNPFKTSTQDFIATNYETDMILKYRAHPERQKAINEILNIGNSSTNSNDALSYALFGKEAKDITPEILDQIRAYAQFLNSKKDN